MTLSTSGGLAQILQEPLTAVVRLRRNRQSAASADVFRNQLKQLLSMAHGEATRTGYSAESIRSAVYALVVFLDESVLNSANPVFAEWARRPLQEELFGGHMGGELFFDNLRALLAREPSDETADVLEVYQLCLLLGFQGRYAAAGQGELERLSAQLADKVKRIRGAYGPLAPDGLPAPDEVLPARQDPWLRPLLYVAGGAFVAALLLLVVLNVYLGSWIGDQLSTIGAR